MDAEKVAELRKKRTFRKFTFRGIELDALLDLTNDELMDLVKARPRRRMSRGLKRKPMALIKKLRKAKSNCGPLAKPAVVKTQLRHMLIVPEMIGSVVSKGNIVIYESTVYPGVTDEICTPVLEEKSSLIFNEEFSTGYSPERIVPGDSVNTIEKIKKVVSASNSNALNVISFLYSSIIDAGIHKAPSIKVAEASKVTENIQRDVNIALINEMHQLYSSLGISSSEVIEAASTKWNFMKLTPGLVGGHCISIDPYYLMHKSKMSGYTPNIMLAARKINDEMGDWVVDNFLEFTKNENTLWVLELCLHCAQLITE